eukprot:5555585-Pyramimonas_sp.AAC.1
MLDMSPEISLHASAWDAAASALAFTRSGTACSRSCLMMGMKAWRSSLGMTTLRSLASFCASACMDLTRKDASWK